MSNDSFHDLFGAPCPPAKAQNPRLETPNEDSSLGPLCDPSSSLADDLGDVADDMRQLLTEAGLRPYRVFSIVTRWTGGAEGLGDEVLVSETEFLPTPFVDLRPVQSQMTAAGRKERGNARLREMSPRYTEDDISQLFPTDLPDDHYSFIEVRHDARDGNTQRRRFTVSDVPWRDAENFEWLVDISVQQTARKRDGQLGGEPTAWPERLRGQVNGE